MKKPQILILGLVYGFLSVYRLLGSDLTNVKGTVAISSLPLSLPKNQFITNSSPLTGEARACPEPCPELVEG
jgi:hypothetical protein